MCPAFLVEGLPLQRVFQSLDLPDALIADIVVFVKAGFIDLVWQLRVTVLAGLVTAEHQKCTSSHVRGKPVGRYGDHVRPPARAHPAVLNQAESVITVGVEVSEVVVISWVDPLNCIPCPMTVTTCELAAPLCSVPVFAFVVASFMVVGV